RSKASPRWAMAANAAPTPPAPTTRILTSASLTQIFGCWWRNAAAPVRRNVAGRLPYAAPIAAASEHEETVTPGAPSRERAPLDLGAEQPPPAGDRNGDGALPQRRKQARGARWALGPSPLITRGEVLVSVLAGVVLAVITTWSLVLHMGTRIAPDLGDPVRTVWQVAWVGHAMLHQPLHIFDSNVFYPHSLSLAFSDSLLGYGPAAFFGSGTVAALVRYNLLFLFAWSLCCGGAYLLARELGVGRIGAAVAGTAFAYAPYRVTEAGHLQVISSGVIPLALF